MIPMMIMTIENDDDRTFITNLYYEYRNLMYAVAWKILRDSQLAEDMVATAITELIADIDRVKNISCCKMRSYIASVVRNDSLDYIRKQKRQGKYSFLPADEHMLDSIPDDTNLEDEVLLRVEMEVLHKCISMLPPKERMLLLMKYVDELDDKEIARILNIGQGSVRTYLSRARKHLLVMVKEDEKNGEGN